MKSLLLVSLISMSASGPGTQQCLDRYCLLTGRPVFLRDAVLSLELRAGTTMLVPNSEIGYIAGGRLACRYVRWSFSLEGEAMLTDTYQTLSSFNGDATLGLTGRLGIGYWPRPNFGLEAGLTAAVFDLGNGALVTRGFLLPDLSVIWRRGRWLASAGWMIGAGMALEPLPSWRPATGLRLRLAYEF